MNQIILDTDPGIDDAIAIAVLRRYCFDRVRLIVASYGNVSLDRTADNVLTVLQLLDWSVPVVRGAEKCDNPLYRDAAYIHGSDGLAGLGRQFLRSAAFEGDYLKKIYDEITEAGTVDYLALGPLTNLAYLIKRFPDVKDRIQSVTVMGGGIGMGNVTSHAEFNIYCDPKSAHEVLTQLDNVSLVPLNVTGKAVLSMEMIHQADCSPFMRQLLTSSYNACAANGEGGAAMHDSTAVLYYLMPELFTKRRCGIDVDCDAYPGMTTENSVRSNVSMAISANVARLTELIIDCVKL